MPLRLTHQTPSGGHEVFAPDELRLLRAAGRVRTWVRGEFLMREGETPDFVVLIIGGLAKVTAESGNGYTSVLALRGPGELIGELSCLDGTTRAATVVAVGRTDGVVVGADAFARLLRKHEALATAVLRSVVARLRESDRERTRLGARSARSVLAGVLLDIALRHGVAVDEPPGALAVLMNQQELAGAAAVSRESVVRVLGAMQRAKLVTTGRGRTVVLDLQGLQSWAAE